MASVNWTLLGMFVGVLVFVFLLVRWDNRRQRKPQTRQARRAAERKRR